MEMTKELFEQLLKRNESPKIDFKRDLYRLKKRDPDEKKSDFIKDVMCIANAKGNETGYIIIGVKSYPGGKKELFGVAEHEHYDDAVLQNLVSSKIEPPINFLYQPFEFDGKSFAIIMIHRSHRRPHRVKKSFGNLIENQVWTRWGSTNREASDIEIGEMYIDRQNLVKRHNDAEQVPLRATIVGWRLDVSHFKGRVEEIKQLHKLLGDQTAKFVCITGRGGIGKTALLYKVCKEIERGELRLSGTATAMGADGIIYIDCRTDNPTVEQIYHDFSRVLGSPHGEELMDHWRDALRSSENKVRFLLSKLQKGCYLLVLDNLETHLTPDNTIADVELREFVDLCLARHHTLRIIATSREQVEVNDQVLRARRLVPLKRLKDTDSVDLLRDNDPDGKFGLRDASEELLTKAAHRCFGVPFALNRIAGILSSHGSPTLEKLLSDTTLFNEKVVENLIEYQYDRIIDDDQKRVLEALAVYNKPVLADAIRYLLEPFYPNIDMDACLRNLVLKYFVTCPPGQDTYELHSLDQEYAYSRIPDDGDYTKQMLHRHAAEFSLSLLTGNERQDVELQLQGWEHLLKAKEYEDAASLALVISHKLRDFRRYVEIMALYFATARTASKVSPKFLARAIDCLCMMGHIDEQESLLKEAADSIDPLTRGLILELNARFYADRGNYTAAISAAKESLSILLELVRKENSPHLRKQLKLDTMHAAHTIAFCLYLQGRYDDAIQQFQDARCLSDELGTEGIKPYQYFLADSLRMVGLLEEARCAMETVLQMDNERIPPAAFMVWGQILQDEGDFDGAWIELQKGKTIANCQGSLNALSRIEWVIGKWYSLNRQFNSALEAYLYARDLFDKFGWIPRLAIVQQEIGFIQHHLCKFPEA